MNKPNILIPQALPSVFEAARAEENWLIFAVGKPDERGKRAKRPVARDKPYVWVNRDKAASFTFDKAVERMKAFRDWDGGLDAINRRAEERREKMIADGKKPGPAIEVEGYRLGYFPREDSALVALDFDNAVHDGVILDFEVAGAVEASEAYVEISSSGTGLRVFMPRQWGDESLHHGEVNDVGVFVSAKGAACAITFDTVKDGAGRDQALFDLVIGRMGAIEERGEDREPVEIADQVLEFGRIEVETFREIVSAVKNDDRFESFDEWFGMVRGAREYYEVVDPDRLDEVREIVEAWCEAWDGGEHDPDKFEDVWERRPRAGSKAGVGSWVHYARECGWKADEAPEEATVPAAIITTRKEALERFVLVGGQFYDRLDRQLLDRGNAGLVNAIARAFTEKTKKGPVPMSADKVISYMRHNAKAYRAVKFLPGEPEIVGDTINSWERPGEYPTGDVSPWFDHIVTLYGREAADILTDWLAFVLQNPGKKAGWAPVLIGPPRCGKDTIITPVVDAIGPHAVPNMGLEALEKEHNGWLERTLLLVMQENVSGRMSKANAAEKLKTMIAAPPNTLPLRKMQKDTVQIPNVLNMAFLSNHMDALYIERENKDRFYPMVTTTKPDEAYFARLHGWLGGGGAEKVVGYLQRRKVTRVTERGRAPMSEYLDAIVAASLPEGGLDVMDYVSDKRWVSTKHLKTAIGSHEFGSSPGWRMTDRGIAAALAAAGFVKPWDRVSVRDGDSVVHHRVYVRAEAVPLSYDLVAEALRQGGEKLSQAQKIPLRGGTEGLKGIGKKIE
jgi:hypothetical protein